MSNYPHMYARPIGAGLCTLLLALGLFGLARQPLQAQGCAFPATVSSQTQLNDAIACFNTRTDPGEYEIRLMAEIDLTASTTTINNTALGASLRIDGAGFTVDGQNTPGVRPFEIAANTTVTMEGITITGGNISSGVGGGIANFGTLTVNNSTVSGNRAGIPQGDGKGGGIYNGGALTVNNSTVSGNFAALHGGGIDNNGALTVTNSTFSGNSADFFGGGIYNVNTLTVTNSTFSGNRAGSGGGLGNGHVMTLANTLIANSPSGGDCVHMPIFSSSMIIDNGYNLIADSANACGLLNGANGNLVGVDPRLDPAGLQDNSGPTKTIALLPGSKAIDAGNNANLPSGIATDQRGETRIFDANGDAVATVDIGAYEVQTACLPFPRTVADEGQLNDAILCYNMQTLPDEYTITLGGGILLTTSTPAIDNTTANVSLRIDGAGNTVDGQEILHLRPFEIDNGTTVTMENITITGGNAPFRGGGAILSTGTLTVVNSTIYGNTAGRGAGIYNAGVLTVNNSTVSGNNASDLGGGIYNSGMMTVLNSTFSGNSAGLGGGAIRNSGTLTVTNSTFSDNSAHAHGGGILNGDVLTVTNSTFSGNSAHEGGGIRNFGVDAILTLANTIIANSPGGGDCFQAATFGTVIDGGHNLIQDSANACGLSHGVNGNLIGQDPQLDPNGLQNNGGATQTIALLSGSPAIDQGDNTTCVDSDTVNNLDQRGITRPQGPTCDIGAVEMERIYSLDGFYAPVENLPVANRANAGQAIPLKFSLGGDFGLDIFAEGYPISQQVACEGDGGSSSTVEETVTAGQSELQYDPATAVYTYIWKTDRSWASTCRHLTVRLNDGTEQSALFHFNGRGGRSAWTEDEQMTTQVFLPLINQ